MITSSALEFWMQLIVALALWLSNLLTIKLMRKKSGYIIISLLFVLLYVLVAILGIHMNMETISQWGWINKLIGG